MVLILGVVLLTNKKPEPRPTPGTASSAQLGPVSATRQRSSSRVIGSSKVHDEEAGEGGGGHGDGDEEGGSLVKKAVGINSDDVVWQIGDDAEDDSDDDVDGKDGKGGVAGEGSNGNVRKIEGEEGQRLISDDGEEDDHDHELATHPTHHPTTAHRGAAVDDDEFGDWEEARAR